jgi:hypothetical protein
MRVSMFAGVSVGMRARNRVSFAILRTGPNAIPRYCGPRRRLPHRSGDVRQSFSRVVLRPMQQISHSQGCPETESGGNRLASSTLAY